MSHPSMALHLHPHSESCVRTAGQHREGQVALGLYYRTQPLACLFKWIVGKVTLGLEERYSLSSKAVCYTNVLGIVVSNGGGHASSQKCGHVRDPWRVVSWQ